MWPQSVDLLSGAADTLTEALRQLFLPGLVFAALALLVKGRAAVAAGRRAASATLTNLWMLLLDAALIAPPLGLAAVALGSMIEASGWRLMTPEDWSVLPPIAVALIATAAADFIGYWRHRLEHTRWLWPAHALHHSDTEMTWLAIFRFHPINRLSTVMIDYALLTLIGFPPYALVIAWLVKHYYGQFVHADLPWTLGRLQWVLVSPAMHRWHHADDPKAYGANFATIFSIFDRAFGTFRVPGACDAPLGVRGLNGRGLLAQLLFPFRPSAYRRRLKAQPRTAAQAQPAHRPRRLGPVGQADPT